MKCLANCVNGRQPDGAAPGTDRACYRCSGTGEEPNGRPSRAAMPKEPYEELLETLPELVDERGPVEASRKVLGDALKAAQARAALAHRYLSVVLSRAIARPLRDRDVHYIRMAAATLGPLRVDLQPVRKMFEEVAKLAPAKPIADVRGMTDEQFHAHVLRTYGVDLPKLTQDLQRPASRTASAERRVDGAGLAAFVASPWRPLLPLERGPKDRGHASTRARRPRRRT